MYNSDTPTRAELPTSRQLVHSTVLAAISALVLLVAVVLPAEYGIDPTGVGRVLRLTEMGKVKQQLTAEAAGDATATAMAPAAEPITAGTTGMATANEAKASAKAVAVGTPKEPVKPATAKIEWRDEIPFVLAPGEGTEIKLKMVQGAKTQYSWNVEGGKVNFDTHGDAPGKSISYEKGRAVVSDEGVLEASFTGNHGWYWRNRGKTSVKVILRTLGDYVDIKKMM